MQPAAVPVADSTSTNAVVKSTVSDGIPTEGLQVDGSGDNTLDFLYDTPMVNHAIPETQIEVPLGLSEDGTTAEAVAVITAPRNGINQGILDAMAEAQRIQEKRAARCCALPETSDSSDGSVASI